MGRGSQQRQHGKSLVLREAGGNYRSYLPLGSQACLSQAAQAGTCLESPQNSKCYRLGHKQQLGMLDGAKVGGVQRKWLDLESKVRLKGQHPGVCFLL